MAIQESQVVLFVRNALLRRQKIVPTLLTLQKNAFPGTPLLQIIKTAVQNYVRILRQPMLLVIPVLLVGKSTLISAFTMKLRAAAETTVLPFVRLVGPISVTKLNV